MIVGTHCDTIGDTTGGSSDSPNTQLLWNTVHSKVGHIFDLHEKIITVDGHAANHPGIKDLKIYLNDAKQRVLQVRIVTLKTTANSTKD